MKYYVVSESELQDLVNTAEAAGQGFARGHEVDRDLEACRTRPVPEWATHFATPTDGSIELADEERGFRFKEIKYD